MTQPEHVVHINVDDAGAGTDIGRDLVGIFFEDLNSAADGGLYAELVRNRAFEFTSLDHPGWGPLTGWTTHALHGADLAISKLDPAFEVNPTHMIARVPDTAGASLTLVNKGYDGILIRANAEYQLSVHLRQLEGSASTVNVALVDPSGVVLASSKLGPLTDAWAPYTHRLHPTANSAGASLVLEVNEPGMVAIDHVSLFPVDTFRGQQNGLRPDLAQALVELKPRFVRFPGGCVSHGLGLENMYRWKDTLGPIEERRQSFNLWGYHQSMGIGYFEYFLLCEQLGAKPLPVVAAGVCCQNLPTGPLPVPDEEMGDYIQEVLDLIEWANGPVDSMWGARRAAAGHAQPFGLEYLAIGNEDEVNGLFRDRFGRIYDAVRAAHPEIVVIGTVGPNPFGRDFDEGWAFARELEVPMVDEHSYKSPRWFFENLDRFDLYDRSGPAVYVGEWGSKNNRLINALAEAAYLGALERNGDVVRLASWAPLFAKVGHLNWEPDLIYFDNENVMPSLNYFVQRMHSTAAGDQSLPVTVEGAPEFQRPESLIVGVSIKSARGTVELTNVRFDEACPIDALYCDKSVADGDPSELVLPIEARESNYTLKLNSKLVEGDNGFIIGFGGVGTSESFELNFGTWSKRHVALFRRTDGYVDEIDDLVPFRVESGQSYAIEVRVIGRGRRITCLVDGEVLSEYVATGSPERRFSATAIRDSASGDVIVKIVNATDTALVGQINLAQGPLEGLVTTEQLAGDPEAGAIGEAAPFEPETAQLALVRGALKIPAWSFTTIRHQPV